MKLAKDIREFRGENPYTFAKLIGMGLTAYLALERKSKRVSLRRIIALADAALAGAMVRNDAEFMALLRHAAKLEPDDYRARAKKVKKAKK